MIDWASRDENGGPSREAFKGKKIAIMSASPGPGGGSRALVHLRAILEQLGAEVVYPQISVGNAQSAFSSQGELTNPTQKEQLQKEISELLQAPARV
jgi:NAD(P)H-dependent FMN reductase